jgi:cytochrome c-type biogenesis protein CcmI
MIAFGVICALLTVTALVSILPPLRRSVTSRGESTSEAEANVVVYRRQFAEMDSDVSDRVVTGEESRLDHEELEQRLIVDLRNAPVGARTASLTTPSSAFLFYGLTVGIPLAAAILYLALGNLASIQPH